MQSELITLQLHFYGTRKERKELLSLIGNCSVLFDLDEDDEDENIE